MDLTADQVEAIQKWASETIQVRAVYLFGSRARGDSHPESDVDLGIAFTVPDERVDDIFVSFGDAWEEHLCAATRLDVSLCHLAGTRTPIHTAAVKRDGIELYRRDWP